MILIGYVFSKIWSAKYVVREISKKSRFRRKFDKEHSKPTQALVKSSQEQFYFN